MHAAVLSAYRSKSSLLRILRNAAQVRHGVKLGWFQYVLRTVHCSVRMLSLVDRRYVSSVSSTKLIMHTSTAKL